MNNSIDAATAERRELLEGKLVHLRLELALVMQELREGSGLTQSELASRLKVQQPAVAKLERAGDHKLESLMRYLCEFDADLLMAVKQGDTTVQVSDDEEHLLVALPREVDEWAAEQDLDLDEFVMQAVSDAHAANQRYHFDPASYIVFSPQNENYGVYAVTQDIRERAA
ncbi:MAG: helix-turn-helix domain-containing protein [Trueperaceae bacterium]